MLFTKTKRRTAYSIVGGRLAGNIHKAKMCARTANRQDLFAMVDKAIADGMEIKRYDPFGNEYPPPYAAGPPSSGSSQASASRLQGTLHDKVP